MDAVVLTGFQKVGFWLLKNISKKYLAKFFPFNENELQIIFSQSPSISINLSDNYCVVYFSFSLNNYTFYKLDISAIEIEMNLNNSSFLNFDKLILKKFYLRQTSNYFLKIPLTYYQTNKVLNLVTSDIGNVYSDIRFSINSKSTLGEKIILKQFQPNVVVTVNK
jgi:hypothetical protein